MRLVALCGGGRVSFYLAKMLLRAGISVLLIEKDPERARELSELLPDADIVLGDATSHTVLEQEDVDRCDAVVSLMPSLIPLTVSPGVRHQSARRAPIR